MAAPPRPDNTRSPRTDAYLEALAVEFPKLRIVDKPDHGPSRLIDGFLRVVTLGGQSAYIDKYTTVLGQSIYVPAGWAERSDESRYITLRHEAVHLRQFKRYTWFGMTLIYGLTFLPMGLAAGRAFIEWEAYKETLRATAEVYGLEAAQSTALHNNIVQQFTGPAYGWMWPFPRAVQRWIDREVERLRERFEGPDDATDDATDNVTDVAAV